MNIAWRVKSPSNKGPIDLMVFTAGLILISRNFYLRSTPTTDEFSNNRVHKLNLNPVGTEYKGWCTHTEREREMYYSVLDLHFKGAKLARSVGIVNKLGPKSQGWKTLNFPVYERRGELKKKPGVMDGNIPPLVYEFFFLSSDRIQLWEMR